VVLQQDQRCRRVIRDVFEYIPLVGVPKRVDALALGPLRSGRRARLRAFFPIDAQTDERANRAAELDCGLPFPKPAFPQARLRAEMMPVAVPGHARCWKPC